VNYNPIIDIALLGTALTIVGLIIHATQKPKRGATPEPDRKKLEEHQAIRRLIAEDKRHGL
jgi:hypothetical protein